MGIRGVLLMTIPILGDNLNRVLLYSTLFESYGINQHNIYNLLICEMASVTAWQK